jgi:integrase
MPSISKVPTGWRARYRNPENRSRSQTFARRATAERFLTSVEHQKLTGTYIDPSAGRVTLRQWWERYRGETPKRATTAARDRAAMTRWWLPALGDRQVAALTPAMVRGVVDAMVAATLAPATVRTNYGVIRAVLAAAVEGDLIGRSPCRGIKMPAENRDRPRFLSADELGRLAEAIPVEYRPMVYVAGVLGLRWSEVVGLRVGRVDFLRRTVEVAETVAEVEGRVVFAEPKTRASRRTVTAPVELMDMLAEHLARRDRPGADKLVFVAPGGGPLRASHFRRRVWAPAVKAAGLEGFTFHGLRHSAVGFMIELGTHARVIQQRAGHASIRTTFDVYGSVLPEVDEAVAKGLGGVLASSSCVTSVSPAVADGNASQPPGR